MLKKWLVNIVSIIGFLALLPVEALFSAHLLEAQLCFEYQLTNQAIVFPSQLVLHSGYLYLPPLAYGFLDDFQLILVSLESLNGLLVVELGLVHLNQLPVQVAQADVDLAEFEEHLEQEGGSGAGRWLSLDVDEDLEGVIVVLQGLWCVLQQEVYCGEVD